MYFGNQIEGNQQNLPTNNGSLTYPLSVKRVKMINLLPNDEDELWKEAADACC